MTEGGGEEAGELEVGVLTSPAALTPEQAQALKAFRQGDLVEGIDSLIITGPEGVMQRVAAPDGVVLVSQTCDIVLDNRLLVQLAPLARLPSRQADEARDGKRPRYIAVPALGPEYFADLELIASVHKGFIAGRGRTSGLLGDVEIRRFSRAIARKFGRFPFPDDVSPWLRPLEEVIAKRSGNEASPEGAILEDVVELRIESTNGWGNAPFDLTLVVVVQPGTLPAFPDDELPELPAGLASWLYDEDGNLKPQSSAVATRLAQAVDPADRYWLWTALAEAWALRCRPKGNVTTAIREAVSSIVGEVVSADEYSLARYRGSEQLDLDHLSGPLPE